MRSTSIAVAGVVLLLGGCSDGPDKPEVPEPGPLQVTQPLPVCLPTDIRLTGVGADLLNTADKPLTIDGVRLVGARDARLVSATLTGRGGEPSIPAADATLGEGGSPDSARELLLELRLIGEDPRLARVTVDYHNVDGRFRAVGELDVTFQAACQG